MRKDAYNISYIIKWRKAPSEELASAFEALDGDRQVTYLSLHDSTDKYMWVLV